MVDIPFFLLVTRIIDHPFDHPRSRRPPPSPLPHSSCSLLEGLSDRTLIVERGAEFSDRDVLWRAR